MMNWTSENIYYERDVLSVTNTPNFKIYTIVIEIMVGDTPHFVTLHADRWKCSCANNNCLAIEQAKGFLDTASQLAETNPLAPSSRKIPLIVLRMAAIANVSPMTVYNIMGDKPVSKQDAIELLNRLTHLTGEDYNLNTVDIDLLEEV